MTDQKSDNITWQIGQVSMEDRQKLNNHKGSVLWFTGLSGSGKSTLAIAVEQVLYKRGCHTYILDGDNIRHGLNKDLGFSPEDRHENIRRIGEVAHILADAGIIAITAFISPYTSDRCLVRDMNTKNHFAEIYCECPLEICEQRDPKGLYKKARAGEIKEFTGIDAPYESPNNPEVIAETNNETVEESALKVISYLEKNGIIPKIS
ncbi:adenylyl-sulfate kinase [Verrucomicrobiota bacterium]